MKKLKTLLFAAASLLVFLVCAVIFGALGNKIDSQNTAERWSGGGERFAQITRYCPVGQNMSFSEIYNLRKQIDSALVQNSITASWTDCYSLKTTASAAGDHASTSAETYAFGGDFFVFHPLLLVDGQYISEDDVSRDRVVLTEALAWKLFGSIKVAGMHMTVNGDNYIVAGVVKEDADMFDKAANASGECMYILYDSLCNFTESNITCYEMVLPDPVDGFALNMIKNISAGEYVQNSGRFGVERIYKVIGSYGSRSMNTLGIIYPYWENASRCCEDWLALVLLAATLAAVFPIFYAAAWGVIAFRAGRGALRRWIKKRKAY